jgi:Aspartyl protease
LKFPHLSASIAVLLSAGIPAQTLSIHAEAQCPGSITTLTPRIVAGALLVIPVKINGAGPFDFMVDTGSQITVIDPVLAAQLNLKSRGTVGLVATASYMQAWVAELDALQVGSHVMAKPAVVVQDMGQIRVADPRIRGALGENFLAHFDVLIDYPHKLLCLDEARAMQDTIRGERIPLVTPKHPENELRFAERLVISVHLSDTGSRQILLQLDSGSDAPTLYSGNRELEEPLLKRATLRGDKRSNAQQGFALLPPQDMRIGARTMREVPFVTPVSASQNIPDREEDGLLPTVLFRRIYICYEDHYVVFDPK